MNILEWIKNKVKETGIADRERLNSMYPEICLDFGYTINQASYRRQVLNVLSRIDEKTSTNSFLNEVIPNNNETYEETATSIKAQRIFTRKPQTLEEVMEMFDVDGKIWECSKWTCSNWDVTSTKAGKTATNYSVKAEFKRRTDIINYQELKEKFIKDVEEYIPNHPVVELKEETSNNLLEICVFDLHFGKLGWSPEVGEDYDHKIARTRFIHVINDIIDKASHLDYERILFVVGNDMFHVDNPENTTSKGTKQDTDVRWQKMFSEGCKLLVEAIDMMSKICPVDVLWVQGNHDFQTGYYASVYLEAWYRNSVLVSINAEPVARKYYLFGNSMIGFTHGDKEKKRLNGIMQIEQPKFWGITKFREWHIAHRHSEHVVEENGLIIRSISSVCGTDSWHFSSGYVGAVKKAQAFVWNYETGLTMTINSVII